VKLFHYIKSEWDKTPLLKKKSYGYLPKKGKLSLSSSDFYKTSLSKKNSSIGFSPKKDGNVDKNSIVKKNTIGEISKNIYKNSLSISTARLSNVINN